MAKRKYNKSEKIRGVLEQMGMDASPKAVVDALAAEKITVTPTHVSNVKSTLKSGGGAAKAKNGRGRPGRPRRAAQGGGDLISIGALERAREFAGQFDSIEEAQQALEVLSTLR